MAETLAANSWSSRSLAQLHASRIPRDMDSPFEPCKPSSEDLHYHTPIVYREMLRIISSQEYQAVVSHVSKCFVYSIAIDGSCDLQMWDNKFVSFRIIQNNPEIEVRNLFLRVTQSELGGASGLLDDVLDALKGID